MSPDSVRDSRHRR